MSVPSNDFIYLLNAFEQASQHDNPSLLDYGPKRKALLEYVAKLESTPRSESAARDDVIEEVAKHVADGSLTYAGPDPQGVRALRDLIVMSIRDMKGKP